MQFSRFLQTDDHVVLEIDDMANVEKIHVKSSDFVTTLITLKLSDYLRGQMYALAKFNSQYIYKA